MRVVRHIDPKNISKLFFLICFIIVFLDSCRNPETIDPEPILPPCGSHTLTGYTNKASYFPGDEIEIFLESDSIVKCGIGFYDIKGSLTFSANVSMHPQIVSPGEVWKNGFNFSGSAKIKLPSTLVSGIYSIENKIPFVVKSRSASDVMVVYPSNTINAYNNSGGKSLYGFNSTDFLAATTVSFLRPTISPTEQAGCIECLKWFPSLFDINIGYISDIDLEDYQSLSHSKIIILIGHSEYWSRNARNHFDRFVNSGGHAIILSGNTMWWQIRYSTNKDALICYRNATLDPEPNLASKTIGWADPSLQYSILSSIGADFDHGGYGLKGDSGWDGFKIFNSNSPLLEGTGLKKGDILSLPSVECDGTPIKGFDQNGFPILDNDKLKFEKLELIGFDRGSRGGSETFPTFIIMQKTKTSGVIINTATNSWCAASGMGSTKSGQKIKMITQNSIVKLLNGSNVFSN